MATARMINNTKKYLYRCKKGLSLSLSLTFLYDSVHCTHSYQARKRENLLYKQSTQGLFKSFQNVPCV